MKTLFALLISFVITSIAVSQVPTNGTVTLSVMGNRTKQIAVDNNLYTIENTTAGEEQTFVITNLENGQHTLDVVRKNQNSSNTTTNKSTFTLRPGFDLAISISSNGSVSLSEKKIDTWRGDGNKAISTTVYNNLYAAIKKKTSSTSRSNFLENEFTNTNKKFTAKQASTLIQLVNSESLRLKLAKQSYSKITDPQNFSLVISLLNSANNRDDLNDYVASMSEDDEDDNSGNDDGNEIRPLTTEKFKVIYNEVIAESSSNDKNYYLLNFFGKDFNHYTSSQARQLIQLVTTEQERFNLAKTAYRGITDRENFGQVSQLLSNPSYKTDLAYYITSYNNAHPMPAMSTAVFNNLYQNISYQNSTANRNTSINKAFITPGNYFSVAQAKQLIQLINDENTRLMLAKTAYKVVVDRSNYAQFNDLFNSQASRNNFNNYISTYDIGGNVGNASVMSDFEFNKLYNSVNDAWSAASRFNLLAEAFQNTRNYFSTYQVRQLLQLIDSEINKLSLAKIAYDNTTDQANYNQLYDLFPTLANKNELAKFINDTQYATGPVIKTPMTDAEFNSIYRDVQFTFGIGAKMSALTGIFNKETNYFTVQQAKQLIQMVSAEYNRLELAKSSYNNITDPANFAQLYDIFSTQASKDELAAYVSSNASINR